MNNLKFEFLAQKKPSVLRDLNDSLNFHSTHSMNTYSTMIGNDIVSPVKTMRTI